MRVIVSMEVDLASGTPDQLFQDIIDELHNQEQIQRGPDGTAFLLYHQMIEAVVIGDTGYVVDEAEEWPVFPDRE